MKISSEMPDDSVNSPAHSPLREFMLLAIGTLVVLVLLYWALGWCAQLVARNSPIRFERQVFGVLSERFSSDRRYRKEAVYLNTLLDRLRVDAAVPDLDYRVVVKESPDSNAAAIPGGAIIVFSGLLKNSKSENEVAMVLAHELGHFANRDHMAGIGRALVWMFISWAVIGPDSSAVESLQTSLQLTDRSFSRSQERSADAFALHLLHKIYGHVGGALDFFRYIAESEKKQPPPWWLFSTHPRTGERIEDLKALIAESGYSQEPTVSLTALKAP